MPEAGKLGWKRHGYLIMRVKAIVTLVILLLMTAARSACNCTY